MTALMPDTIRCAHDDTGLCGFCGDLCDVYDQPRWLCPHCAEFAVATAATRERQPTAPDKPARVAGYWSLRTDGRGDWQSRWHAVDAGTGDHDKLTHVAVIDCSPTHLGDDQTGLCWMCTGLLTKLLADVPKLLHHLEVSRVGDQKFVEHGTYRADTDADHVRLEWNERAASASKRIRLAVQLITEAAFPTTYGWRDNTIQQAQLVVSEIGRIQQLPTMPRLAAKFSRAIAAGHSAIDRPADTWCYGPCPDCGNDIYQERLSDTDLEARVSCGHPDCPYTAPLRDHQQRIIDANEHKLLTVKQLVGAIAWAGTLVTRDQIDGWVRRGHLTPRTIPGRVDLIDGRFVRQPDVAGYPLGEALQLAIDAQNRKNRRAT